MENTPRRYQFATFGLHFLDLKLAVQSVLDNGGKRPRICFPDMGTWLGTNQPETVSFTATREAAQKIVAAYGKEKVHFQEKNR